MANINWIQWAMKKGVMERKDMKLGKYGAQGKLGWGTGSDMAKIHVYMHEILKGKHYVKILTVSRRLRDRWDIKDLS